jgi:hypothetical protein
MDASDPFSSFVECLPPDWFQEELAREGLSPEGTQVFTCALTCWLMVLQALGRGASLAFALAQLRAGSGSSLSGDPERVREGAVSSATGAYARARGRLPALLVERASDAIFWHLSGKEPGDFLLDGTSLRAPSTPALRKAFPPAPNQHGTSHWPVIRVVVAHELGRALATRPAWGPMFGEEATGEQALAEAVLARIPKGSRVVADRNFGVFSIAWACCARGLVPVVRMTLSRAKALAGKAGLPWGEAREVVWNPSAEERKKHRGLPAGAQLRGRLVAMRVPRGGKEPLELFLFTTDEALGVPELVELYARRWCVETDLRTLKSHLRLEDLRSLSPAMVGKELLTAVTAYNLVRALMGEAARLRGLDPRRLSFSWSLSLVRAFGDGCAVPEGERAQRLLEAVASKVNPEREREETDRKLWPRPRGYPYRKCQPKEGEASSTSSS